MMTTSLIHHKPPPLKTRNDNPAVYLRTNNYYGSMGRPSHGRRKSAVELLQETKAFYVKTVEVLDNKQEFKNAEHLHVTGSRSPTHNMDGTQSLGHIYRERGSGGNGPPPSAPPTMSTFPYATFSYTCGTCPPYPHEHLDHLHLMHSNYLNSIKREKHSHHHHHKSSKHNNANSTPSYHHSQLPKVTAKITVIDGTKTIPGENWSGFEKEARPSSTKRSVAPLPPGTFQPIPRKELASNSSGSGSAKSNKGSQNAATAGVGVGVPAVAIRNAEMCQPTTTGTLTFTSFSQSGSLYSSLEKHMATANLPIITSKSSQGKVRERKDPFESDSPPPLPPKSPRTTSKPSRPSDFPQRLIQVPPPHQNTDPSNSNSVMLPPPPPRKHRSRSGTSAGDPSDSNTGTVIRRPSQSHGQTTEPTSTISQPMTLPSPILPPTPPPDVVMESPMSDSGPIISPPPAFSTPVTPMLDRQNSDRSTKTFGASTTNPTTNRTNNQTAKAPLSAAVSMSGVSSISSRSQSHGDDVSMRYSSRLSSSSPMSHQDVDPGSGGCSRRPSESASNSVFSSNVSMAQNISQSRSNSNTASPSEEEEEEENSEDGGISADIDGDDDDSSRAADDHVQHYLLSVSSSSKQLSRNNSRKSVMSADGVMMTTTPSATTMSSSTGVKRSPSRGRTGRKVSTSSSGEGGKKSSGGVSITINKAADNDENGKLSKSITENFLCRVTNNSQSQSQALDYSGSTNHYMEVGQNHAQTLPISQQHSSKPRIVSPVRRPILRSKSDLSHRYMKAGRSATLTPGFTLVHVDLGPPPPIPLHNSVSTTDFHTAVTTNITSSGKINHYQTPPPQLYYHQHSSTPNNGGVGSGNHYHQPQPHPTSYTHHHAYHTLQPSTHYSQQVHGHHYPSPLNATSHHSGHIYARPSSSTYENLLQHVGKTELVVNDPNAVSSLCLDHFFDQLGLEKKIPTDSPLPAFSRSPPLNAQQIGIGKGNRDGVDATGSESPVFFSSISSIDSCARKSGSGDSEDSPIPPGKLGVAKTVGAPGYSPPNNNGGGGNNNQNINNNGNGHSIIVHHGEPSIVERNARVIKWLFNCRKAMENR